MTRSYKIFSRAYRIILVLITIGNLISTFVFSNPGQNGSETESWLLLFYCLITLTMLTSFHQLSNTNQYRILIQILVCLLVLFSLAFLVYFVFLVFKEGDSNLLVSSVLFISILVNAGLLFHLIQDKKHNVQGQRAL